MNPVYPAAQAPQPMMPAKKRFDFSRIIKTIQALPQDQLFAFGAVILGLILIILALLLW